METFTGDRAPDVVKGEQAKTIKRARTILEESDEVVILVSVSMGFFFRELSMIEG